MQNASQCARSRPESDHTERVELFKEAGKTGSAVIFEIDEPLAAKRGANVAIGPRLL